MKFNGPLRVRFNQPVTTWSPSVTKDYEGWAITSDGEWLPLGAPIDVRIKQPVAAPITVDLVFRAYPVTRACVVAVAAVRTDTKMGFYHLGTARLATGDQLSVNLTFALDL